MPARTPALLAALLALATLAGACAHDEPAPAPRPAHATGPSVARPSQAGSLPAPPRVRRYVALGDSYTAAPLVPPTDTSTVCLRSRVNYPALVARQLPGARLTDVSCGGATTADMWVRQRGHGGSVPPQLAALRRGTDLVTIGIGGNNDNLFGTTLARCTQLRASDPAGSPCADEFGDALVPVLSRIRQHVARVVRGVRARAPHARVLVVGYPQIVPASGTCPDLPLATGDYRYARRVNEGLARAVGRAAHDAHATYVDLWGPSRDHDICARDPWINGRVTSAARALAYHPLAVEQEHVAGLVLDALRR